MSNLKLIIRREFVSRVRNKTFVVMTFLSPLIFVGMISLITWLTTLNEDKIHKVAFLDETGLFSSELQDLDTVQYVDYSNYTLDDAKDSVIIKNLYGLLYLPKDISNKKPYKSIQFFADESPNISVLNDIEKIISTKLTNQNLESQGFDLNIIEKAEAKVSIQIENFTGEKTSKMSNYIKMFFGGAAGYLLMMFIIIYGNMVMRSVIEEKANRIIEIIISSVKPIHLMIGKILGTSLAGTLQFFIWVILGGVLLVVVNSIFGLGYQSIELEQSLELQQSSQQEIQLIIQDILKLPLLEMIVLFFIYFIGGYFLYSSIYAAIGAAVDSETDSQQFMLPIILPLMLGIYVGFFAVIENPHGTVSFVFSMIPLTSPIVMLMRVPFGVSWWEIVISVLLLFSSIALIVWFAAKIYKVGILMYGKKPSYRELLKWLKY